MTKVQQNAEERVIKDLDDAWNNVYVQNDRAQFADILADDFLGSLA